MGLNPPDLSILIRNDRGLDSIKNKYLILKLKVARRVLCTTPPQLFVKYIRHSMCLAFCASMRKIRLEEQILCLKNKI